MTTLAKSFAGLREGDAFATGRRTVTEADVLAFARLTGDLHPQHVDRLHSESGHFGEPVAHGMLVLSLAFGLLQVDPDRVVALRRIADAVFARPVRFGDEIRVEGRVLGLVEGRGDADPGVVTLRLDVLDQTDRVVCRVRAEALWR